MPEPIASIAPDAAWVEAWRRALHVLAPAAGMSPSSFATAPERWAPALARHGLLAWPGWLAERRLVEASPVASSWLAQARAATHAQAQVRSRLLEHLRAAGVTATPLKGAWTSAHLYPEAALRPSSDVDLWIPAAVLERAAIALRALEFRPATPVLPRWNFEWTFVGPHGAIVDLHVAPCAWWRVAWRWQPVPEPSCADAAATRWHAAHALAHFAQHKGVLRLVQEIDLLRFDALGTWATVQAGLEPALRLWRARAAALWGQSPSPRRTAMLSFFYDATALEPTGSGTARWLRERALGWWLSTRRRGWWRQLLRWGRPTDPAPPP